MREEGFEVSVKKRKRYSTYQGEVSPSVSSELQRDFHADKSNEKWLTNLTESSIPVGRAYLSLIVDCFDGMVPYWMIRATLDASLVNSMLNRVWEKENIPLKPMQMI